MTGPLIVTAYLSSPLAGDPPHLDALLEYAMANFEPGFRERQDGGLAHYQVDRSRPAPPQGEIPIPVLRVGVGPWQVPCCSSPILPKPDTETVEHVNKRLSVENAGLLAENERKVVSTTNSWTKSYRLPLRVRSISCVKWFCQGNERNLKKCFRYIHSIGKKISDGYGKVSRWETEPAPEDWSWFAKCEQGTILMRPLPLLADDREWLPKDLIGFRRHFGSCVAPYWHPERFTEIVLPC